MNELTMKQPNREAFLADLHVGVITVAREEEAPLAAPVCTAMSPVATSCSSSSQQARRSSFEHQPRRRLPLENLR
jgi:hypothetical protein